MSGGLNHFSCISGRITIKPCDNSAKRSPGTVHLKELSSRRDRKRLIFTQTYSLMILGETLVLALPSLNGAAFLKCLWDAVTTNGRLKRANPLAEASDAAL